MRIWLVGVAVSGLLLLSVGDLTDREWWGVVNVLVIVALATLCAAIYRLLSGDRGWQRWLRAWVGRPVTQWNDWRVIVLLAGNALGFHLLGVVDLPDRDRWSSASVLLLLTVCLAAQMISVAFFKKRDRK
jgi:hypothetical protein